VYTSEYLCTSTSEQVHIMISGAISISQNNSSAMERFPVAGITSSHMYLIVVKTSTNILQGIIRAKSSKQNLSYTLLFYKL
jgi:hypothetical protein